MVGEEFWLRFFRLKVYNNPVRDTLYLYFFRHKKVPRTVILGTETVLVRLSGTPHGGLEESMPDEIQMPLDNVRTKKGHPIDQSAFESMIIVRPGIRMSDGSVIPTVVHAFCEFEEVHLSNLAFNKTVQGAVSNVKETQKLLESGVQPFSLKGKGYLDIERIAKESLAMMGKTPKDEIKFEEFKVVLASLEINHTEARAYKWFVLGDVNRNGSMDLGELTFVLFVVANSKPSRLLRPRDVFLMFDVDSKPSTQKDRPGTIDLIGFYESVRAFNSSVSQDAIEKVFKRADEKRLHRLGYVDFLSAWIQLVSVKVELEKRGISLKSVLGADVPQTGNDDADEQAGQLLQQFLLRTLRDEDEEEDADLHLAVDRAHHARGKVRAGREKGKRGRIKRKAETDKAVRRQKALEERAKRLAAIKAQEQATQRASQETELHRKALADKQEREKQELEQIRRAAFEADEAEKRMRRELALDRIYMQNKGLSYVPSTLWLDPASQKHLPFVITFDISSNALMRLPEKNLFQTMGQLRKLDCSGNRLKSVPDAISSCHELLILKLDDNKLEALPDMSGLDQLQVLSVRGNCITRVGEQTVALRSLKRLNLSLNPLAHLGDDAFLNMGALVELHLQSCDLEFLPTSTFQSMNSLKKLFLSGNKLRELPESLQCLQSLEELDASHNSLRMLPGGVGSLVNLIQLDLSHNQLRVLPEDLSGLRCLLRFDVENNVLTSLPDSLGQMVSLQLLSVSSNGLCVLPDVLGRLEDLQVLNVSRNQLTCFPSTIGGLIRVKHVDASHNKLGAGGVSCFPQSFASLQAVEWLDVSFNRIQRIAPQVSGLSALVFSNFSHNELQELPAQLCILPQVKILDVSFNRLVELPVEFGMMSTLEAVDLSCNLLKSIPDCVGDLKSLRHLHVYNNRLNKLPLAMSALFRGLVSFDCARNPLRSLPAKFVAAHVLGAGGLNLRFSRSNVAGKNVLSEIRDGLQRDVEREQLIAVDTEFDIREADRASMRLEDSRVEQWKRAQIHTKLLNYSLPTLWKPVDFADSAEGFRSTADNFPNNIDDWWKERGHAEKRRREQMQHEQNRRRNIIRSQLLAEEAVPSGVASMSEVDRTHMRASTDGNETAQQRLRAYEALWRQEDKNLEWSSLDAKWAEKLHQRVSEQEDVRASLHASQEQARLADIRSKFWREQGLEAPEEGQVLSLREVHSASVQSAPGGISVPEALNETRSQQHELSEGSTHPKAQRDKLYKNGSGTSQMGVALSMNSGDPCRGALDNAAQAREQPGSSEQQRCGETTTNVIFESQGLSASAPCVQAASIPELQVAAAALAAKIQRHDAKTASKRKAHTKRDDSISESAQVELEGIERDLRHGPPAPVVGAFRRAGGSGRRGGLTDRLMTPYDKGSRLHALALGKGRPGSIELSVRRTLISGQALSGVVKTAHTNSRFNYQTSSMYKHHRDISSLADRKQALIKMTGKAIEPAPFRGRFNLSSYEAFDQSRSVPLETVDDLRQSNRGKVVGSSRFSCEEYPLYKDSITTQLAEAPKQQSGFEASSIPTTVQQEAKSDGVLEAVEPGIAAGANFVKQGKKPQGIKISDLPRRTKTHRYNMTKSMVNINPNRTTGGSAFNAQLARKKLADIQRRILAATTVPGENLDTLLGAMFGADSVASDHPQTELSKLQNFVRDLEMDPKVPTSASELQEVRQILMECSAAGASSSGLIPDIQPRAWQPAGYKLSQKDAQNKLLKAKQLIMALKLGGCSGDGAAAAANQIARTQFLRPVRDDAWEVERAELSAPSATSVISLAESAAFGDKLSSNLWSNSPYEPVQGVGFDAAQSSVLAKANNATTNSESKTELALLSQAKRALDLSAEVPRALVSKMATSKSDRRRARRWQSSGQQGDHNSKPRIDDIANLGQASNGYTPSDVADYLAVQAVVHEPCMAEWVCNGGLYMEGGLRMSDFISCVRRRLKQEWDASFTEAVKRFFLDTRACGGEPTVLSFEDSSTVAAKEKRAEHHQHLRGEHHQRVIKKMDAMRDAKLDKYAVSAELLRRRMVSQEGRAAAMKEFKQQSWLRQIRTESRAAATRQAQSMVGNYKEDKDSHRAETARLVEDTARRAQKLDRKARDRETYKALLAQGVVPTHGNPLFNHSSLTLPGASESSIPGFFAHSHTDAGSEGGPYEGDSQEEEPVTADEAPPAKAVDSLEEFADRFLTAEEAALLSVASPPARQFTMQQASVEALASLELSPSKTDHRKNPAAQVAGGAILRQGSVDWAAGFAANSVSQLYDSARQVFVDGTQRPSK